MARKDKPGIKYFSQDSDHVLNKKIKLLFNEFDSHGPWVYECLKCEIYGKKGYYFDLNDVDELMIFATDVCKKPVSLVKEIIAGCVRRELFDKSVLDMFNVLTSDRIQNNFLDSNREKRKKGYGIDIIIEYWIVGFSDNEKKIELISLKNKEYRETLENYREKLNISREKVHKGEEMRGNEIRGEERDTREALKDPPVFDLIFNFFKENTKSEVNPWDEELCKTVAKKFIVEYENKWDKLEKDGWQSKAKKWILTEYAPPDGKAKAGTQTKFPDIFSQKFENTLSAKEQVVYWAHLRSKGLVAKKDRTGRITDWVKNENIVQNSNTDWQSQLASKIGKEKI